MSGEAFRSSQPGRIRPPWRRRQAGRNRHAHEENGDSKKERETKLLRNGRGEKRRGRAGRANGLLASVLCVGDGVGVAAVRC
jgi:hypothetical protein